MSDTTLRYALGEARQLLRPPARGRESIWPVLAAAAFFAISALTFAAAAILAPPVKSSPPAHDSLRGAN
jgi:hypothetical protein